ncbi:hypothetical protein GCM10023212_25970 [Luteolibacter yonseiensis]
MKAESLSGIADRWQASLDDSSGALQPFPAPPMGKIQDEMVEPAEKVQKVYLIMPSSVTEGGDSKVATLQFSYPEKTSLTFTVAGYPKGRLVFPSKVRMKAGKKSVSFKFSVKDDKATTLNQLVGIKLAIPEYKFEILNVCPSFDNEKPPVVKLAVPSSFQEGDMLSKTATLTLSRALDKDGFVTLVQSPENQLAIPEQIVIPAGKTSVDFPISALQNDLIEGDSLITISAKAGKSTLAKARTTLSDNDRLLLSFEMPEKVSEGGKVAGKVTIPGTLKNDLKVLLSAVNGSGLSFPASVTIWAGLREATFQVSALQNTRLDGTREAVISARAGNVSAKDRGLVVTDDDVAGYRVSVLDGVVAPGQPRKIKVSAVDVEGNIVTGFSGPVNLALIISGGGSQPTSPSLVHLSSGYWSGKVTIPASSSLATALTARDSAGRNGGSGHFDSVRTLGLKAVDLIWDPLRERIYASVPTGAVHQVVAIDPNTMQITGGVATGQDPGKLALTSGGEYLYVSLKGNGTIAKIDPATMTVAAVFSAGSGAGGALYAADIATVPGQPDLVVATRSPLDRNTVNNSVAVYENGVPRQAVTPVRDGGNFLYPTSDPTVFLDFANRWHNSSPSITRRMLKVTAGGISEEPEARIIRMWWTPRTRIYGDMVLFPEGDVYDWEKLKPLGKYSYGGSVCPDAASHRVFYLERYQAGTLSGAVTKLAAYDPVTQNPIDALDLPAIPDDPVDFIRWGESGLAFCNSDTLMLVNSPRLLPSQAATDLVTSIEVPSTPPAVGQWVDCKVTVTNRGPNPARNAYLSVGFSDKVEIKRASADHGLHEIVGDGANLTVDELAAGMSATLNLTVTSASVASIACTALARSSAVDPDFSNSGSHALINYGHWDGPNARNKVGLVGCGQVYDPARKLIWISNAASTELYPVYSPSDGAYEYYYDPVRKIKPPVSRSVVSMDPYTGRISKPIPLNADPAPGAMALSDNGRYLFVGLRDVGEISRIDLQASPPETVRIVLPKDPYSAVPQASDIEALEGDGTSIIVTIKGGGYVAAIDGSTARKVKVERFSFTDTNLITFINRTANPAVFTGVGGMLYRLSVTPEGVWVNKTREKPHGGDFSSSGSGELWMWNMNLFEVGSLAQVVNLLPWSYGLSILENPRNRAYFLDATKITAFDTVTRSRLGELSLVKHEWELNERSFMRWGSDGFSILNDDGVFLARWALAAPAVVVSRSDAPMMPEATGNATDADGDGIPHAFEQLFGSSSSGFDPNPVKLTTATEGGKSVIRLRFPRRVGMTMSDYGYEISPDLKNWKPVDAVSEVPLSLEWINGVNVENIETTFEAPDSGSGFVRLRWR